MTCCGFVDKIKIAIPLVAAALSQQAIAEPSVDKKELPRIPPTEPAEAIATFRIVPGYRLELVAAEPLVSDPIAMAFDERRRLFVVEMRGYSERRDEKLGRIRLLYDDDGDGKFDRSTIYARDLPWPTAVIAWDGGIFVAATPDIYYFKDEDGDGVSDSKTTVFSGFGAGTNRLNVQALVNNFKWGPDGRIHGAAAGNGGRVYRVGETRSRITELRGLDFSFDPETLDFRAENGGGQYGLCFDGDGRKFVCSNSNHIQQVMYARRYAGPPLPAARVKIARQAAAEVFRISPDEPWRIVRTRWRVAGEVKGPIEGGGRVSGYFTAATGIEIHQRDAYICDAGSNLVHRKHLAHLDWHVQLHASRPDGERDVEFLASTDNWFRPVQCLSGPDGALYIADMYRELIEHPWSIPESIKKHLDLNSGSDRGRIYRIVPDNFVQPPPVDLAGLPTSDLLARLSGFDRNQAARVLRQRKDPATLSALKKSIRSALELQLLHQLGGLDEAQLLNALSSPRRDVRNQALVLSEQFDPLPDKVKPKLAALLRMNDPADMSRYDPDLPFQLALTLGLREGAWRLPTLAEILAAPDDEWVEAAALKAIGGSPGAAFEHLMGSQPQPDLRQVIALARMIARTGTDREIAKIREFATASDHRFRILAALSEQRFGDAWILDIADEVKQSAADSSKPIGERRAAIQLHGAWLDIDEEPANLLELLVSTDETEIRDAVAEALVRWDTVESAGLIVDQWDRFSPQGKVHATSAMLRNVRSMVFLKAIDDGKIPVHSIDGATVDRLRGHGRAATRKLAASIFDESFGVRDKLSHYWGALELDGDPTEGKTIYLGRCAICHKSRDEGFDYGPDVASFRSAGKELILTNMIDPNREIPPQYVAHEIRLKNGGRVAGRILTENDRQIQLSMPAGVRQTIERKNVDKLTPLPNSPMPERLESGLTRQQIADLLAFLVR